MKHILFVDDDKDVLNALRRLLRTESGRWSLVWVNGPEEALAEIARQRFDVVISDLRMPVMDGAELLGRIRDAQPDAGRVVLSGAAEHSIFERAVGVAHEVLSKPVSRCEIIACIERHLPGKVAVAV